MRSDYEVGRGIFGFFPFFLAASLFARDRDRPPRRPFLRAASVFLGEETFPARLNRAKSRCASRRVSGSLRSGETVSAPSRASGSRLKATGAGRPNSSPAAALAALRSAQSICFLRISTVFFRVTWPTLAILPWPTASTRALRAISRHSIYWSRLVCISQAIILWRYPPAGKQYFSCASTEAKRTESGRINNLEVVVPLSAHVTTPPTTQSTRHTDTCGLTSSRQAGVAPRGWRQPAPDCPQRNRSCRTSGPGVVRPRHRQRGRPGDEHHSDGQPSARRTVRQHWFLSGQSEPDSHPPSPRRPGQRRGHHQGP